MPNKISGRYVAKRVVRSVEMVGFPVIGEGLPQLLAGANVSRIDGFVFERRPHPFDKDVVERPARPR